MFITILPSAIATFPVGQKEHNGEEEDAGDGAWNRNGFGDKEVEEDSDEGEDEENAGEADGEVRFLWW